MSDTEEKKPGDYKIFFGRWGAQNPKGIKIKHLPANDVFWLAEKCVGHPEAARQALAYIQGTEALRTLKREKRPRRSQFGKGFKK